MLADPCTKTQRDHRPSTARHRAPGHGGGASGAAEAAAGAAPGRAPGHAARLPFRPVRNA